MTSSKPAPRAIRKLLDRISHPSHGKLRGSYIDPVIVAQAISDWMDGDSVEKVADRYAFPYRTVWQWVHGENRANILQQVEQARRRAGLPVRYPRSIV